MGSIIDIRKKRPCFVEDQWHAISQRRMVTFAENFVRTEKFTAGVAIVHYALLVVV